jgi:hypothetical protein
MIKFVAKILIAHSARDATLNVIAKYSSAFLGKRYTNIPMGTNLVRLNRAIIILEAHPL